MPNILTPIGQSFTNKPNIAATYGPYASIAAAHVALSDDNLNIIGMTVGIQVDANHIEEYWYQGGTTQAHLIKKQMVEDIPASALAGDIPANKLSSGVQTSLGKADTAYQKPGTGIPASDLASAVQTSLGKADTAYQKPGTGIPASDLASAVQTSLGKADTAVQPADIAALDGNPTGTSADGHVSVQVTEVDGVVNAVNVTTNDIASASALAGEVSRAQGAESALDAAKADKATTLYGYGITNAYTKSEVDGLVSTPHQNYVTVADYASLPATGSDDTIYRVSCWDGAYNSGAGQVDDTKYTEYAWNGTAYVLLRVMDATAEVFDISAYNNATYDDLTDALGVSGANVPADLRAGGMSVKFVNTATNQYEQWRLMSATWSIVVSDWQGVDSQVIAGSKNLVNGDAVASTHIQQFALILTQYPSLDTTLRTFTIPAGANIVKQGVARIYELDSDVVYHAPAGQGGNYLIYDVQSNNTRFVNYDERVVLGADEVIIAYLRWEQGVFEGRFLKYYLNDTLIDFKPDATLYNAIQSNQSQISANTTNISRNKFVSDVVNRYLEGITDEITGTFVQAGVISGDGTIISASNYSIYKYSVSEGQKVFIASRITTQSTINNRSAAYAYSGDTPVESVLAFSVPRFDCNEYTVPSGVDNICVYSSDTYGQYVGLISSDGEVGKIKAIVDEISTQLEELKDEVAHETIYTKDDVYKDDGDKTYYLTTLNGGIGTVVPSPSKSSSFGADYYATIPSIEVKKGDVVIISSQTRGSTDRARLWAFTDVDKKILDVAGWEEADKSTIANPLEYHVQQDGYCVVNVSPKTIDGFYVKVIHNRINILEDRVEDVEERTAELEEVVSNASFDDVEATSSTTGEYITYSNGTLYTGAASSRVHNVYSVNEGDVYSIKCDSIGVAGAVVAFFDSNGNYIKESSIQGKTDAVVRIIAVVPVGAATMHVSHVTTNIHIKKALGCPMNITGVNKAAASYVINNVVDADAQSVNPLEVVKETPGYAAIFHRIGVIGGSTATGAQEYDIPSEGSKGSEEYSVIQRVAAMYGGTAFNFSVGGMSARRWITDTLIGGASTKFNNNPVQGYFVQLGNNDLNDHWRTTDDPDRDPSVTPYLLGSINDVNVGNEDANPDTFYGNLSKVIAKIRGVQPNAYIFLCTFIRNYNNQHYYTQSLDDIGFNYNVAIREIYNVYRAASNTALSQGVAATPRFLLLDYYTYGKDWPYFNTGIHIKAREGTHLSPAGYQYQAYEFATYVDWLVKNDMKYFNDVRWVGVELHEGQGDYIMTRDDVYN